MSKKKKHHLLHRPNPNPPPPPKNNPTPASPTRHRVIPIPSPHSQFPSTLHAECPLLDHASTPLSSPSPDTTDLESALARANDPNRTKDDIIHLSLTLRQYPDLYNQMGNLASLSQIHLASNITTETLQREAILLVANDMRQKLTRPTDTALEHALVEQCVNAYMVHYDLEIEFAGATLSPRNNVQDLRLNHSQKRLIRAVETLARLRQLALPIVQINVTPPAPPPPDPPYIEPDPSD